MHCIVFNKKISIVHMPNCTAHISIHVAFLSAFIYFFPNLYFFLIMYILCKAEIKFFLFKNLLEFFFLLDLKVMFWLSLEM